jgi:excisionase family DNA binding protein
MTTRTKLTPPEVAARWGVSADKVLAWIRNGELRAVNAATRAHGRPRWLVDLADLEVFEQRRAARPVQPAPRRRRQPASAEKTYF